jgi:hypothetical protein
LVFHTTSTRIRARSRVGSDRAAARACGERRRSNAKAKLHSAVENVDMRWAPAHSWGTGNLEITARCPQRPAAPHHARLQRRTRRAIALRDLGNPAPASAGPRSLRVCPLPLHTLTSARSVITQWTWARPKWSRQGQAHIPQATSSTRILNLHFVSHMASYECVVCLTRPCRPTHFEPSFLRVATRSDVASNICQALARHVIHTMLKN